MRLLLGILAAILVSSPAVAETRLKDVASFVGVRANHLIGYGLVIGLNGTGDSGRNAPFTKQSVEAMLDRMGVNIRGAQARTRNVAAVMVMAELPAFALPGSRIDVTVASLGDASSLSGGSLLMTPLMGADETIYAVAQGPVVVSGFAAQGRAEQVTNGTPTAARIPNGALVEREAPGEISADTGFALELRNPDFATAVRVADVVNVYGMRRFGQKVARERDNRIISLRRPASMSATRFLAEVGELIVRPDTAARVVVDERTGTIVIGRDVQISTVAVAHGSISVRVTESQNVSQPQPLSDGQTVVTPETVVSMDEQGGSVAIIRGTSLQSLVSGLNRIGLKPSGIIAVLQAVKSAGALQAELVVQ